MTRKLTVIVACLVVAAVGGAHFALAGIGGRADRSVGLELVGHHDLGGQGWNTDVWAHGKFAYVGTWGLYGYDCLDGAVKVISLEDPSHPEQVQTIYSPEHTQANDVKVARIDTQYFHGDVLAVSNEDCDEGGARGVEFWDVSDPRNPVRLSRYGPEEAYDIPADLVEIGYGVHNTFIFEQGGRAYVGLVADYAEIFQLIFGVDAGDRVGDVRFLDITDPRNPTMVGDWGIVKNLGQDPFSGQGTDSVLSFPHDIWVENGVAYVSYWDAGLVLLDVSDPTDPQFISQTKYASSEEGNTHVAVPAQAGNLVIVGDEDFTPGPWGFFRIFDTSDETQPTEIATFATENAQTATPATVTGDFSAHNVVVRGNRAYLSWYGDGVRVLDISNPSRPREIGSYVPPSVADPQGFFPTAANVWGIHVHGDLILASCTNGGLYILKQKR